MEDWYQSNYWVDQRITLLTEEVAAVKKKLVEYQNLLIEKESVHNQQVQEFSDQIKNKEAQIQKLCSQLKFIIVEHERLRKENKQALQQKDKEITRWKTMLNLFKEEKNSGKYEVLKRIYKENEVLKMQAKFLTQKINKQVCKDIELLNLKKSNSFYKEQIMKLSAQFDELFYQNTQVQVLKKQIYIQRQQNESLLSFMNDERQLLETRLSREKKQLLANIEAKEKDIKKLLDFLKKQNNIKNEDQQKYQNQIMNIKQKIKNKEKQIIQINNVVNTMKGDLNEKNKEIKNLQKQIDSKDDKISKLNYQIQVVGGEASSLTFLLNEKEVEVSNLIKNCENHNKKFNQAIKSKDRQINTLKDSLAQEKDSKNQQIQRYNKIKNLYDSMNLQANSNQQLITKLQRQNKGLKQESQNLSKNVQSTGTRNNELESEVRKVKRQMQQKLDAKEKQNNNKLADAYRNGKNQTEERYQRQIKNLKEEIGNLKNNYRSKDEDRDKLQRQNASLRNQYNNLANRVAQLKKQNADFEREKQRYRNQIQNLKNQLREASSKQSYSNYSSNSTSYENLFAGLKKAYQQPEKPAKKYPEINCPHFRNGGTCNNCIRKYKA